MVGFPCLLGGATSVLLGTKHESWIVGIPERLAKGLLAGFVLGFTYMVLLSVLFAFTIRTYPYTASQHSSGMWSAGTLAMTVSSALYFLMFHWSAGLNDNTHEGGEPRDAPESSS